MKVLTLAMDDVDGKRGARVISGYELMHVESLMEPWLAKVDAFLNLCPPQITAPFISIVSTSKDSRGSLWAHAYALGSFIIRWVSYTPNLEF